MVYYNTVKYITIHQDKMTTLGFPRILTGTLYGFSQ